MNEIILNIYGQNKGMFIKMGKSFRCNPDEITNIGLRCVWKAITTFNCDNGTKFSTYLYTLFLRECIDFYRFTCNSNIEYNDAADKGYVELYPEVLNCLDGLDEADAKLLTDKYLRSMTYREIGQQFGISPQAAQLRVAKALKNAR